MRIGIIGNGVVGNATAQAFKDQHEVRIHDKVRERATHDLAGTLRGADLVFVCLPTPQLEPYLCCDTEWVESFFNDSLVAGNVGLNLVLRSTVPVGFTRKMREKYNLPNLVHSPEFLTARTAVYDAKNPTRLIIGGPPVTSVQSCGSVLHKLYEDTWPHIKHVKGRAIKNGLDFGMLGCGGSPRECGCPIYCMTSDESEAVKMFQNSFSAVKIAMFNEMRALADNYSMDWSHVLSALLAGGWINPAHTQVPGPDGKRGFGGTCLPKDLANLISCLRDAGLEDNISFAAHTRNKKDRG